MDESTASNVLHVSIGWMDAFRALPAFGLVYLAWRFRKALFANAKTVMTCAVALACLSSAGVSGYRVVKSVKVKDAWNNIALVAAQNKIEQQNAEAKAAQEQTEQNAELVQWKRIVPGKWSQLFNEMEQCRYYESRVLALTSFIERYADDEPELTAVGYDRFLAIVVGDIPTTIPEGLSASEYDELMEKVDTGEIRLGADARDIATARRLGQIKTLLAPFVCPLSAQPAYVVAQNE